MSNLFNYFESIKEASSKTRIYKCCDCKNKYQSIYVLYKHILNEHRDNIPVGIPVEQYYFNRKRNISHGPFCVICKKNYTQWNPRTNKYHRFCSEACKKKAGELFHKNYIAKHGKDYSINNPEQQKKMQSGRRISGTYKFSDGGELEYGSSYEQHFLEYCDRKLELTSNDISRCPFEFYYLYKYPDENEPKTHFYMPDFYIESLRLIIEIKDGGDNPNMHHKIQSIDKEKEKLKDKAIIESKSYNYIKIVNKDYEDFNKILDLLKNKEFDENNNSKWIICIPMTEYKLTEEKIIQKISMEDF